MTTRTLTNGLPTMTRPELPRLAAMTAEATERARAILAGDAAALSTRTPTRPGPLPSAAPHGAPSRPSKR